jgi:hypothetical protein
VSAAWDFDTAVSKSRDASAGQRSAEKFMRDAFADFAKAEEAYRIALSQEIITLHNSGVAWTVCGDVARGNEKVARLRRERDIAEGVKEAAVQAAWRAAADRRDTARFSDWSARRDIAEGIVPDQGPADVQPIGSRRAA